MNMRVKAKMTQTDLANACGCSRITISSVETGKTKASFSLLERIAEALKCTVADLVTGAKLWKGE